MKVKLNNIKKFIFVLSCFLIYGITIKIGNQNSYILSNKLFNKVLEIVNTPNNYLFEGGVNFLRVVKNPQLLFFKSPQLLVSNKYKDLLKDNNSGFKFFYEPGTKEKSGYLILSGTNPNNATPFVEIWDLNNQKVVHSYNLKKDTLKKIKNDLDLINNHDYLFFASPILNDDGSFTAIANNISLITFDKCGNIERFNKEFEFHHSIESDSQGNIYVPISFVPNESYFFSFQGLNNSKRKFRNEGFAVLDRKSLEVKKIFSIKDVLIKDGFLKDALDNTRYESDPFHLNDVHPVKNEKEETLVLLSLRHYGLMLYNLSSEQLVWLIKGSTDTQHDISPIDGNLRNISIFDNGSIFNSYDNSYKGNTIFKVTNLPVERVNGKPSVFYGEKFDTQSIKSKRIYMNDIKNLITPTTFTGGKGEFFNGLNNIYVEESNAGRLFEFNFKDKTLLWEYINKDKNSKNQAMVHWSRRINSLPINFKFNPDNCN